MKYFVGFDGGSTYLKAALFDGKQVVDTLVCNTGIDNNGTSEDMLRKSCKKNGLARNDIGYIMATGYSRKILELADDDISEITAHAYGVRVTAPKEYHPGIVVDIGGQDSKIIYLDENYNIRNFTMNDKCAAGTGKFLEIAAQILETTIDQIGPLSLESKEPCDINSTCVVFAQSEVISLVARKYDRRDILYGMHLSMAKRIIKMIVSAFLSAYIVSHGNGVKKSFGTFMLFFSGKLLGVSVLCLAVSTIGKQFISEKGYIGDFPFRLAVQVMMGLFGFFMAVRWFREIRKGMAECGHCK